MYLLTKERRVLSVKERTRKSTHEVMKRVAVLMGEFPVFTALDEVLVSKGRTFLPGRARAPLSYRAVADTGSCLSMIPQGRRMFIFTGVIAIIRRGGVVDIKWSQGEVCLHPNNLRGYYFISFPQFDSEHTTEEPLH